RSVDGAQQRFSRALDFGYSKNPEETFNFWNRREVLEDLLRSIETQRPDIIITRFPDDGRGGHGHHTASCMLAEEAFEYLKSNAYEGEADPKRLFWNTWVPYYDKDYDVSKLISVDVGTYDPLLGKSYLEIASEARSMHKCQAFGTAKRQGSRIEYLELLMGEKAEGDMFEGIDISWSRVEGGAAVGKLLSKAEKKFDPSNPGIILPELIKAYKLVTSDKVEKGYWTTKKTQELRELIQQVSGLWTEALSDKPTTAKGDSADVVLRLVNRNGLAFKLRNYRLNKLASQEVNISLPNNQPYEEKIQVSTISTPVSQPYWLTGKPTKGMFRTNGSTLIGLPENPPTFVVTVGLSLQDGKEQLDFDLPLPVVHKYVDRAVGELYRPFVVVPNVTANLDSKVYLFPSEESQEIIVLVTSHQETRYAGEIGLKLPEGWKATPEFREVTLDKKGAQMPISFTLTPPRGQSVTSLEVREKGGTVLPGMEEISYDHIPTQLIFSTAEAKIVRVSMTGNEGKIGYIMGSGDEVPACLTQIGYEVTVLEDEQITTEQLAQFDAVIAGIRAYNRRNRMPFFHEQLMEYVKEGGTYLVQYNTTYGLLVKQPGPYPIKVSRDRVTVEEAEVTLLQPDHPAFNIPNKITSADFEGWVQERGLYFPNEWDDKYEALTALNDPGESPKKGALLVTKYGEGHFIYSGFSWFRELPAGVPGAYRLMVNLLALGSE
ncbi:MAG: LmbE family protein, partial [Bacteroidota bacterium]